MKLRKSIYTIIAIGLLLTTVNASAIQYSFDNITNNNAANATAGETQLFLDVTSLGADQVYFLFTNTGPAASSITDIYFDDDVPILSFAGFTQSAGVSFAAEATPPNLPGGNDPLYHFSSNYSYDSSSPIQPMGVNPGESLGITFNLINSGDVFSALTSSSLRVGIHVQGFANGGSESFINNTVAPVPEPTTMLLFGTGLIGLAAIGRRKTS